MDTHDQALFISFLKKDSGVLFRKKDWEKIQKFLLENLSEEKIKELKDMQIPHFNISISKN